jgi:hypothetical protein
MRKAIINFKNRALLKKEKERQNLGYKNAKLVGILFIGGNQEKDEAVLSLKEALEADGKLVRLLKFEKIDKTQPSELPSFDAKSFGLFGQIQSLEVTEFCAEKFSYLFHLDANSNPYTNFVLVNCEAECRVGIHSLGNESYYDFMIKQEKNLNQQELFKRMLEYTKILA